MWLPCFSHVFLIFLVSSWLLLLEFLQCGAEACKRQSWHCPCFQFPGSCGCCAVHFSHHSNPSLQNFSIKFLLCSWLFHKLGQSRGFGAKAANLSPLFQLSESHRGGKENFWIKKLSPQLPKGKRTLLLQSKAAESLNSENTTG